MNARCNTFIYIATGFAVVCGCTEQHLPRVIVSSKNFHIQLPLTYNKRGITVATYWGQEKNSADAEPGQSFSHLGEQQYYCRQYSH